MELPIAIEDCLGLKREGILCWKKIWIGEWWVQEEGQECVTDPNQRFVGFNKDSIVNRSHPLSTKSVPWSY